MPVPVSPRFPTLSVSQSCNTLPRTLASRIRADRIPNAVRSETVLLALAWPVSSATRRIADRNASATQNVPVTSPALTTSVEILARVLAGRTPYAASSVTHPTASASPSTRATRSARVIRFVRILQWGKS